MKYPFILLAFTTLLCTGVRAQETIDVNTLNAYFDSLALHQQGMGTAAIFKGDTQVYTRSVGFADPELDVAAAPEMVYRVGSITKTFTTVIVHRLEMAGKLSLEDKLAKYYPDLPTADQITLNQMLRHQSGLFNYTMADGVDKWIGKPQTKAELLALIQAGGSNFEPGTSVEYSNSNFLLLGYIAERVSEKPYRQLLRDYVIKPCGLENTYVGTSEIVAERGEVVSYDWGGQTWQAADLWDLSNAGAAGNISSTASDLGRFYRKLIRGELLPEARVKQMMQMKGGLGQGLLSAPFGAATGYGHNGGIEGFETMALHFPEEDITIVYLANGVRLPFNDVLIAIGKVAFGVPLVVPDLKPAPPMSEAEASAYLGHYKADAFPLDIEITFSGGGLVAQATGQGTIPLNAEGDHTFTHAAASLTLIFDPETKTMKLQQLGNEFVFERE